MPNMLPNLRDDLQLLPGPPENGFPTWTLYDPVRHRFYRVGWPEFELLARWHLNDAEQVLDRVHQETTLGPAPEDLEALKRFLSDNCLLEPRDPDILNHLKVRAVRNRGGVFTWLLRHYLFIRIPLFHPDRFLDATLPAARIFVSRPFLWLLTAAAFLSFFLTIRQWEAFTHTFSYFFSLKGVFLYALTLFFVKMFHELGHAYTARHYGLRVPTMGLAFLVFWPMFYTDNSDAWKLRGRTSRMAIAGAGTLIELGLAVPATFLWSFLPDGPLRSVCFLIAATTWISSLLINLNPFLRFDGYYLLSDFLNVPNLQARAFALGKWHLRRFLAGLESPCPEPSFSDGKRRLLIGYAYSTWLYRLMLFTAIALMVYHLFFKMLGIFLFGTQMIWFVCRPVYRELCVWRRFCLSQNLPGFGSLRLLLLLILFILLLAVPWNSRVSIPALLRPGTSVRIYPPFSARIHAVQVKNGQEVRPGQLLFLLKSPQLLFRERRAETRVRLLEEQLKRLIGSRDLLEQTQVVQRRLAGALTELQGCRARKEQLRITAPTDGIITDMADGLRPGMWVRNDQMLTLLINRDRMIIEGYLAEESLESVKSGDSGRFYMENRDTPAIDCTVQEIDPTGSRTLNTPCLASVYGGDIPVSYDSSKMLVSRESLYRVILIPDKSSFSDGKLPCQIVRGSVYIRGRPRSFLGSAWRRVITVLIRESGF
ncbi:HlyD family efflux transporter periplasmic adaptor subunit [Desulfobacterales bacterium HSG2]|nr:HlyD family efflux transporter periplasmic adaptor subunit [Desulfobacterales bacterium HSG2]